MENSISSRNPDPIASQADDDRRVRRAQIPVNVSPVSGGHLRGRAHRVHEGKGALRAEHHGHVQEPGLRRHVPAAGLPVRHGLYLW